MKELFVPYSIAIALQEIEFTEHCLANYFVFGDGQLRNGKYGQTEPELFIENSVEEREKELNLFAYHDVSVPLYDQVINWFIKKHRVSLEPIWIIANKAWTLQIYPIEGGKVYLESRYVERHEAINAGIEKVIEQIKQRRNYGTDDQ